MAEALQAKRPDLSVVGVDVVGLNDHPHLPLVQYDGVTLPFPDKSFETVLIHQVLHHCEQPLRAFEECLRVAKSRLVVIEPGYRHVLDRIMLRVIDTLANRLQGHTIPMPYTFRPIYYWGDVTAEYDIDVVRHELVGIYPSWWPVGVTELWVMERGGK